MAVLGTRLKSLRDITGETRAEVGKALGKSWESVKKYETGERQPDLDSVAKLARHFNISADYILGLSDVECSPVSLDINQYPEYDEFKEHMKDRGFIRYVRLGARIYENKLDLSYFERLVEDMLSRIKKKWSTPK